MGLSWARQKAAPIERRRSERYALDCPASFRTISGDRRGRLENISEEGARLALVPPPKLRISGMLAFAGEEIFCTVVWANGDACGLEFERPLRLQTILELAGEKANPVGPIARTSNIPLGTKRSGRLVAPQPDFFSRRQACSRGSV